MKKDREMLGKLVERSKATRKQVADEIRAEGKRLIAIADAIHKTAGRPPAA